MVYYRVRMKYDNLYKNSKVHDDNVFAGGELFTVTEVVRLKRKHPEVFKKYSDLLECVNVNRNETHRFMGARFSDKECFEMND